MAANSSIYQHEPLRVPTKWRSDPESKAFISQLDGILDDIYAWRNRIKLVNLSDELAALFSKTPTGVKITGDLEAVKGTFTELASANEDGSITIGVCKISKDNIRFGTDVFTALQLNYIADVGGDLLTDGTFTFNGEHFNFNAPTSVQGARLPVIDFGAGAARISTVTAVSFAQTYEVAPTVVACYSPGGFESEAWGQLEVYDITTTGFNVRCGGSAPTAFTPFTWISVGYYDVPETP